MAATFAALGACLAVGAWAAREDADEFPYVPFDHPAIDYMNRTGDEAISKLQEKLDRGEVKLPFDARYGYLPGLLKQFGINADSQLLVFSKTSFQGPKISPRHPRALYFNDDVAIGSVVDGDVMEFTAFSPTQGVVFYTMDRAKSDHPTFRRRGMECLNCHLIPGTLYVPGLLATSVIPRPDGSPRFAAAAVIVDSRTPLEQRWGGWYVTGLSGSLVHRGNAFAPNPEQPSVLDTAHTQNLTSVKDRFDSEPYVQPASDLIALMVLEHQTRMSSLLTRLGWETRIAEKDGKTKEFEKRLEFLTDEVASYMLFEKEAAMHDPMSGVSTFTKTFAARGPRDEQGRSLRDFDLQTRLFRHRLSYMIYDRAFDALPEMARNLVYRKLFDKLHGGDADRQAALEILRATKPGLPEYWRNRRAGE